MIIEQAKSLGESFGALSNKDVKVFLFNSTIPATEAEIPFDPTDVLSVYNASVAMVESVLSYDSATGKIQFRPNSDKVGLDFKGTGEDVTREGAYWCVPTSISTTLPIDADAQFEFTDLLTQDVTQGESKYEGTGPINSGEYIEFGFGYNADIDGIDFSFPNALNIADFTVQYWDSVGEEFVDITSVDTAAATDQRIAFGATYNTNMIRFVFTSNSTNVVRMHHIRFFSNVAPTTNVDTSAPVSWCMMFFDLRGHGASSAIDNWPFIWMNVGSALSPAELTIANTAIQPGKAARLIFCELEGKHVEDTL
jgi:hypothetical protein